MISVRKVSPFQEDVSRLIEELDRYQGALYPAASNHLDSKETLSKANSILMAAYEGDQICGMGAIKLFDQYGEIKRMYVPDGVKGKGVAGVILRELEKIALTFGINVIRLETGVHQLRAIHFYRKSGYSEIPPFGEYRPDPLSLFMEKKLTVAGR